MAAGLALNYGDRSPILQTLFGRRTRLSDPQPRDRATIQQR